MTPSEILWSTAAVAVSQSICISVSVFCIYIGPPRVSYWFENDSLVSIHGTPPRRDGGGCQIRDVVSIAAQTTSHVHFRCTRGRPRFRDDEQPTAG